VAIGYTIMGEQAGPKQLVDDAIRAEEVGFDWADHTLLPELRRLP
jgi:hypothetical protein